MAESDRRSPETVQGLTERQAMVLRAVIASYVGEASPVGSTTVAHLLPVPLSSASIRNTMAELTALGLICKPHASAGRMPTEAGLRLFVDCLLDPRNLGAYEKRDLADSLDAARAQTVTHAVSHLLSERTRQLGFVMAPRIERVVLRHVSLVRLTSRRLLVVLVSRTGTAYQRLVEDDGRSDQAELDRMAALLAERVCGLTLRQVRDRLQRETQALRSQADRLLARAVALGARALSQEPGELEDLVIVSWLALLDQPEFQDLEQIRRIVEAVETKEHLVAILDEMLSDEGVRVTFGEEVGEPTLRECALVAAPYGDRSAPLGVLGVIGPRRMDYARVIPLVDYLSTLVTEKLNA